MNKKQAAGGDSSVGAKAATSVLAAIPAYDALTSAQYAASKAVLAELDRQDALKAERDGAKNELETYVFEARSYLREFDEEVSKVAIEGQPEELMENLTLAEDWLYEPEGACLFAPRLCPVQAFLSSRLVFICSEQYFSASHHTHTHTLSLSLSFSLSPPSLAS